jgi:hypothetical protein
MADKSIPMDLDEYIKSLEGEYSREELDEMKEICYEEIRKGNVDWREYMTYKRLDVHPDPEEAKMGRPI